jgi:RimJ/RimL family protein N-acetyltransferase
MSARGTICAASAPVGESLIVADGTRISFRQVRADDRAGIATLFDRLTPQSRHHRFLSPKRELTPRELTFFTDIDHLNHEAIAAVDRRDGSIVGVARYVRDPDRADVADVAIEVADAFQRMGIGTALADLTIQRAHANGLTLLTATTLWENRAARGLLRHHRFRARQSRGGEIEHQLELGQLGPAHRDPLGRRCPPRRLADPAAPTGVRGRRAHYMRTLLPGRLSRTCCTGPPARTSSPGAVASFAHLDASAK